MYNKFVKTREQANRLLKLASYLEKQVDREKFDMATFFNVKGYYEDTSLFNKFQDFRHNKITGEQFINTCGTTACAMGHACFIPEFKKLGLKAKQGEPAYKNVRGGFATAQVFFGINSNIADYLFDPIFYPKGKQNSKSYVVKRIRSIANGKSRLNPEYGCSPTYY